MYVYICPVVLTEEGTITTPTQWSEAAIVLYLSTSTCRAARPQQRLSSMASSSCRRRLRGLRLCKCGTASSAGRWDTSFVVICADMCICVLCLSHAHAWPRPLHDQHCHAPPLRCAEASIMMACSSTLEAELMHAHREGGQREMELLKDLPSHDRENFSKFSQGSWKVSELRKIDVQLFIVTASI